MPSQVAHIGAHPGDVREGQIGLEADRRRQWRRARDQHAGPKTSTGLGTALIGALAKQLNAQVSEPQAAKGLTVEVTRSTFKSRLPVAA